jgi:hypothetical protein
MLTHRYLPGVSNLTDNKARKNIATTAFYEGNNKNKIIIFISYYRL